MQRSAVIWIICVVLLGMLAWLCVRHHVPEIEADLAQRASQALFEAEITQVKVDRVEGLDVFLTDTGVGANIHERAVQAVSAVPGVHSVYPAVVRAPIQSLVPPANPDSFVANYADQELVLSGAVKDVSTRASLVGFARRIFTTSQVVDRLTVVPSIPDEWSTICRASLEQLALLTHGQFELGLNTASLTGAAPTAEVAADAQSAISERLGESFEARFEILVAGSVPTVLQDCQAQVDELLRGNAVRFGSGSDVISIDSHPLLDRIATTLSRCEKFRFEVRGHTDARGDPRNNQMLSDARAQAVVNYFRDEGVDAARMTPRGYGATSPVATNNTADGRAQNRRMEIVILEN